MSRCLECFIYGIVRVIQIAHNRITPFGQFIWFMLPAQIGSTLHPRRSDPASLPKTTDVEDSLWNDLPFSYDIPYTASGQN